MGLDPTEQNTWQRSDQHAFAGLEATSNGMTAKLGTLSISGAYGTQEQIEAAALKALEEVATQAAEQGLTAGDLEMNFYAHFNEFLEENSNIKVPEDEMDLFVLGANFEIAQADEPALEYNNYELAQKANELEPAGGVEYASAYTPAAPGTP